MQFDIVVFVWGVVGGVLAEILKWFQLRESANWPEYARRPGYWIITALIALAGGVLAWAYGLDASRPLLALNVGISAPLIIKGLAGVVPPSPEARTSPESRDLAAPRASVMAFLAGK